MKKPIIIVTVLVFLLGAASAYYFKNGGDQENVKNPPASAEAKDFSSRMQITALGKVGQPIEGFNAFLYLQAYPGLTEEDFAGVETGEGKYVYSNGELTFQRTRVDVITSAEGAISVEGHATLLKNLRQRLDADLTMDEIFAHISVAHAE